MDERSFYGIALYVLVKLIQRFFDNCRPLALTFVT
jgi:hypothetical protein